MLTKDTLDTILQNSLRAMGPFQAKDGEQFIVTPNGEVKSIAFLSPPSRIKQTVALIDAGSFCDYVNRFKNPDTLIFATVTEHGAKLTAILDYHGAPARPTAETATELPPVVPPATVSIPGMPMYCNHRATLELIQTEDWKKWNAAEGQDNAMTQEEFAVWLEEHAYLFNGVKDGALKGADLLQMVSTLFAKSNVRYNRAIRLSDGKNSLDYEEDTSVQGATSTGGKVDFPPMINAGLQPFEGGPTYQVDARLKVRINQRALVIWFETCQKHKIVRDAVLGTVKMVTEKTGIIPLIGSAA